MIIRPLNPSDTASVYKIEQQRPFSWTASQIQESFHLAYIMLGSVSENQITGYIAARIIEEELEILNLHVDPIYHRQGIASALLSTLMAHALKKNVKRIFLEVRSSNLAAQQLYFKKGFFFINKRENYYPTQDGTNEPALVLGFTF